MVKVPFGSYEFEVLPVFVRDDGRHLTAHTKNGGSWRYCDPHSEYRWLRDVDARTVGKATHLIKMLKAWKRECNVDLKSVCLEIVAGAFVDQWVYRDKTLYYYDWMIRDFFAFLIAGHSVGGWAKPAGIEDRIQFGDNWQSKAQTAYERSLKACEYEHADQGYNATSEWQKIFGEQFVLDIPNLLLSLGLGAQS